MEHFFVDPDERCFVRTVEEYYRYKDALIQRKLEELRKRGGNNAEVENFSRNEDHSKETTPIQVGSRTVGNSSTTIRPNQDQCKILYLTPTRTISNG
jgi:hypothetical protein